VNSYTPANPPGGGSGKKIWDYAVAHGVPIVELHYNPNNWGQSRESGWGTWACQFAPGTEANRITPHGAWCGWLAEEGRAYVQGMTGGYRMVDMAEMGERDA
jgi:hypothetical protein